LLDPGDVSWLDSSGLGDLVGAYATVRPKAPKIKRENIVLQKTGQFVKSLPLQASWQPTGPALIHDVRQSLVRPDCHVLKLPRLLPRWRHSLPLELPCESSEQRSCYYPQGMLGELGILSGGFRESKAVQFGVDLNRLHAIIIPS